MPSQPVYLIDVSFLKLILLKIVGILHDLKAVLEDQLDEFVVNLECFLYPRIIQVSVGLVDDLDRCRLVCTLDLDRRRTTVEVVVVILIEALLTLTH